MKVHNANSTDDVPSTEVEEEENKSVKCEEKNKSSGIDRNRRWKQNLTSQKKKTSKIKRLIFSISFILSSYLYIHFCMFALLK